MRAATSSEWARARSWQSQRVTRRSVELCLAAGAPAGFQPVPLHSGQTATEGLADLMSLTSLITGAFRFEIEVLLRLCTGSGDSRKPERMTLCVHPVKERDGLWRSEENGAGLCEKPLLQTKFTQMEVRNRLPVRIFTVDNSPWREENTSDQVSQLSHIMQSSRCGLGTKETCEEKL
jgi:hypothetical protein